MLKPKIYITIAAILGTMVISGNSFAHTISTIKKYAY